MDCNLSSGQNAFLVGCCLSGAAADAYMHSQCGPVVREAASWPEHRRLNNKTCISHFKTTNPPAAHSQSLELNGKHVSETFYFFCSCCCFCWIQNIKNVLLVMGSISELSLKQRELINSCGKVITDLKSLLRLNSLLIAVDMKINYSVCACFQAALMIIQSSERYTRRKRCFERKGQVQVYFPQWLTLI